MKKRELIGLLLFSVLVGVGCYALLNGVAYSGSDGAEFYGDESGAWSATKQVIKRRLKCPATAEFPRQRDHVTSLDDGWFCIVAYVDAQNGFGALIRIHFTAIVQHDHGDYYKVESLETSEQ